MNSENNFKNGHFQWSNQSNTKTNAPSPAIMQSYDCLPLPSIEFNGMSTTEDVTLHGASSLEWNNDLITFDDTISSFLLIDANEYIKVSNSEQLIQKLQIPHQECKVKVVSIFGNTGDGKSHTLNHTFFNGEELFHTSNTQSSCTLGVWAAFDPKLKIICLDTEGLLGITSHENVRTRLLLKVLAISDIVVYRTRSERLHRDLFTFLGTASKVYSHYFQSALQIVSEKEGLRTTSALGPSVIIFHETRHTRPLSNNGIESPEDILLERFAQTELEIKAFSSIKYVGVQTTDLPTNYEPLKIAIENELNNITIRSARKPYHVFTTLKTLNDTFSGKMENVTDILFPDQYFTCPVKCYSCESRCQSSMGHLQEGKPHTCDQKCQYQHQYENLVYICKKCHDNGNEVVVTRSIQTQNDSSWYGLAKYAWSGYVIECPQCGEIYRSRQHWYGNKNPEDSAVITEISHVWSLETSTSSASQNTAQRVVDSVSYLSEAVANISLQPTKAITAWMADQVAPSYWRPNSAIIHCHSCKMIFVSTDTKHHCRACGEGFCDHCSSKTKCVPEKNWHTPVRVCDDCFEKNPSEDLNECADDVSVRKVSETVFSTLSVVGSVLSYSKSLVKDQARPSYWVPDSEITNCNICNKTFGSSVTLHHCRDCGRGVCQECSPHRKPVPRRGWEHKVRVCDLCFKLD